MLSRFYCCCQASVSVKQFQNCLFSQKEKATPLNYLFNIINIKYIVLKTFLNHRTFSIYLSYYFVCVISFIHLPFTNSEVIGYFCGVVGS